MASFIQNGNILGMTGRGARNNPPRADGSTLEPGIHLRWQMNPDLGFPSGGFDLYRRNENYRRHLRCGAFYEADGILFWDPYQVEQPDNTRLDFTASGDFHVISACPPVEQLSAAFPGEQTVRIDFSLPVRYVRMLFDIQTEPNPVAEAYWETDEGDVLVASNRAYRLGSYRYLHVFGNRIDHIVLTGEDMVLCVFCFVGVNDGRHDDWEKTPLNGKTPIYLPITNPNWNAPHPNSPNDHAEASERLPANLPVKKRAEYETGFADELRGILDALVGTEEHRLFKIQEADPESNSTIDWPGMSLLHLMAIDPNIARILGLYWHDVPPSLNAFYDYRVVAHYEQQLLPGKVIRYKHLNPTVRYGSVLIDQTISYSSPNPIEVTDAPFDGSTHRALLFTHSIWFSPISISFSTSFESVDLKISSEKGFTIKSFNGPLLQATDNVGGGEHALHLKNSGGINMITIYPLDEVILFEMELRDKNDVLDDIIYDVYHLRANTSPAFPTPNLEMPVAEPSTTGTDENGIFQRDQHRVGLRWNLHEAGADFLEAGSPVLFHIQRDELDSDTDTIMGSRLLNEDKPTLVSTIDAPNYSDQHVPEGIYQYSVRGIDLFGVLGEWSDPERIEVQDLYAPPAPQAVEAQYLDPADPWLHADDAAWAQVNGPGIKVSWIWPGAFGFQAPDVIPPDAEFRVYAKLGPLNELRGHVLNVKDRGNESVLDTTVDIPSKLNNLVGESIRINDQFFTIQDNTQGASASILVNNLELPTQIPEPGPCSITLNQRQHRTNFKRAKNWDRRMHIEPVGNFPLVFGEVIQVIDEDDPALISQGATRIVTINQLMPEESLSVPGALMCNGMLYRVYAHAQDTSLHLHIAPIINPTDSLEMIEPAIGEACEYSPGWRYEAYIPDVVLEIPLGEPSAIAHVAVSCSDGKTHVSDAPRWSNPGRGGLGGRPGNESALSQVARITAYNRTSPDTVAGVPEAPPDPIFARPANYYGIASYTLSWDATPGVDGYAVYRCSGGMLFETDRALREQESGVYASTVFFDDPGFQDWLQAYDPSITESNMTSDPIGHADAWRAWADRFYSSLTDQEVQALANRVGNEHPFRRLNQDVWAATQYEDAFDGRGRGFYLYRIRTIDSAGNESAWSDTFPPVHIYDIMPPVTPGIISVNGGEQHIALRWTANREPDLLEYRIWQHQDPTVLQDIRRLEPHAVIVPDEEAIVVYADEGLAGLQSYFYRVAAVDTNGNISEPTPLLSARVADATPPNPPIWETAEWVRMDPSGQPHPYDDPAAVAFQPVIQLQWLADEVVASATIERKGAFDTFWRSVATLTRPIDNADPDAEDARRFAFYDKDASERLAYAYRIRLHDEAGLTNTRFFHEASVPAALQS